MYLATPNYSLHLVLYEGSDTIVYKGHRDADNLPVIIKILKEENPPAWKVEKLKGEYHLLKQLKLPCVAAPLSLERVRERWMLVLEDIGGMPIGTLLEKGIDSAKAFEIATSVIEALIEIHKNHILHKNINPHNILFSEEADRVQYMNFDEASIFPREFCNYTLIDAKEERYLAPEQKYVWGVIDNRTDIYSLGVVLYELLAGKAFVSIEECKEVLQGNDESPYGISAAIGDTIVKCLEKDAAKRFQSVEELLESFTHDGKSKESLKEPLFAYSKEICLSQKLFGREEEVRWLRDACKGGATTGFKLICLSGALGVGKTRLAEEVSTFHEEGISDFFHGRCDMLQRRSPYLLWRQVFTMLIQKVLLKSAQDIELWRDKCLRTLGQNISLVADIVPEVKLLLGTTIFDLYNPSTHPFHLREMVYEALASFLQLLLEPSKTSAIFLDDLQWIDSSSLQLLHYFLHTPLTSKVICIAAYREEEVDEKHPVTKALENLHKEGVRVHRLSVMPLQMPAIKDLVETAWSDSEIPDLYEVVYKLSHGIPLYIIPLLKYFHEKKKVFSGDDRTVEIAPTLQVPNLIVEFFLQKMSSFSESAQEILKLAVALGNSFDIDTMAALNNNAMEGHLDSLGLAVEEDFLLPYKENRSLTFLEESNSSEVLFYIFIFHHNLIRHIIYDSCDEKLRKSLHLRLAKAFLTDTSQHKKQDRIYDIANQLIESKNIFEEEMRIMAPEIFLKAGKRAKDSAAFDVAREYFLQGASLLTEQCWSKRYSLCYELFDNLANSTWVLGNYEEAESLFSTLEGYAKTLKEKGEISLSKIAMYSHMGNIDKAYESARKGLQLFDVDLCHYDKFADIWEKAKLFTNKYLKHMNNLTRCRIAIDANTHMVNRIFYALWEVSSHQNQNISEAILPQWLNYIFKYGLTEYCLPALMTYAAMLGTDKKNHNYSKAFEIGSTTMLCVNKFTRCQSSMEATLLFFGLINRFGSPQKENIEIVKNLAKQAKASGNIPFMCICYSFAGMYYLLTGERLDIVRQALQQHLVDVAHHPKSEGATFLNILYKTCLALQGFIAESDQFPKDIDTTGLLTEEKQRATVYSAILQLMLLYIHDKYSDALSIADNISDKTSQLPSHPVWGLYHFYYALTLTSLCLEKGVNPQWLRQLLAEANVLKSYAEAYPLNYLSHYQIISAEIAYLKDNKAKVLNLYNEARISSQQNGCLQNEALVHERMAVYYLRNDQEGAGALEVLEACHCYAKWGANYKLKLLQMKYEKLLHKYFGNKRMLLAFLLLNVGVEENAYANTLTYEQAKAVQRVGWEFNISTLIQAAQSIVEEIRLEPLIEKLMHFIMSNAQVEHIFFLKKNAGSYFVSAEIAFGQDHITMRNNLPVEARQNTLCLSIIQEVDKEKKEILFNDASQEAHYDNDTYIKSKQIKALGCLPLIHQGEIVGLFYLENRLNKAPFAVGLHSVIMLLPIMSTALIKAAHHEDLLSKAEEHAKELKTSQNQLIQQEKMASLGLLTAGIAHEIKNPLNFIINFSELSIGLMDEFQELIEKYKQHLTKEEVEEMLSSLESLKTNNVTINEQGKRANNIIKRMLAHSSTSTGEFLETDLHALLEEAIALSYHGMRAQNSAFNVTFVKELDPKATKVFIVPHDLSRVFLNLLDNAYYSVTQRKQSGDGEYVPTLWIKTKFFDDHFEIIIRDNGNGIPEHVIAKIFTPFFTTKPIGKGTGLGLSISHNIVTKQHGGTLNFSTKEGEYTEFIISIPMGKMGGGDEVIPK